MAGSASASEDGVRGGRAEAERTVAGVSEWSSTTVPGGRTGPARTVGGHRAPQYGQATGPPFGAGSSSNSAGSQVWPRGQRMVEADIERGPVGRAIPHSGRRG